MIGQLDARLLQQRPITLRFLQPPPIFVKTDEPLQGLLGGLVVETAFLPQHRVAIQELGDGTTVNKSIPTRIR